MTKLRVEAFSISTDAYGSGAHQTLEDPFGTNNVSLHDWMFATSFWREMVGQEGGSTDLDDTMARNGFAGIGASIMGRNMFSPTRGGWAEGRGIDGDVVDTDWKGWWGPNPPYHHDVFVLTHHARDPIPMEGGTTFHFVTDGIRSAYDRAVEAAAGADIRLNGGASTIRQYLRAGLVDEMHLVITDVLVGSGESPYTDVDLPALGYRVRELIPSSTVTHVIIDRA